MALLILSGLQVLATLCVGALLWRRLDSATREIAQLRKALVVAETAVAAEPRKRAAGGEALRLAAVEGGAGALPRTITELRRREPLAPAHPKSEAILSPETVRGLALAVAGAAPAIGFFITGVTPAIVAAALVIAAAMMLIALRPLWRGAAWASVIAASAWTSVGFALGAATQAPAIFCAALTIAGAAGLGHAHLRRATPGVTLAFVMAAAALALGAETGLISAAGAAFGLLTAFAAIIGALSFRLESLHLAAFAASLIGLFALSGQQEAAIWFTPVTAWLGAVFLAIAGLRAPELGARGLVLASTGALAAIGSVAALHASGHGLADPNAAAGAFAAVSLALAGIILLSARREQRGLAELGLTLWTLAFAAFVALAASIWIALLPPLAAPAFAALALALIALDRRAPHAVWRVLAWIAGALAAIMLVGAILMLLGEARNWAPWALIALGVGLPAALAGGTAFIAERKPPAFATASAFESFAILAGVGVASLALRAIAANGAVMLAPIGFAEAGLHIAFWLGAALLIASRAQFGARKVRSIAMSVLGAASLAACAVIALLWLTPYWTAREASSLIQFKPLGFLAPAVLFAAHWAFWRRRKTRNARIALAAAAFMAAASITLVTLQAREGGAPGIDWISVSIIAFAFALAVGVNFAPSLSGVDLIGLTRAGRGQVRVKARVKARGEARGEAR